jgi:putative endonuclease
MHYVYVLRGPTQFYTGCTKDLRRRLDQHSQDRSFSTRGKGPWKLVYYEASESSKDAFTREKYLKTAWGKRYLKGRLKFGLNYLTG